MTEILKPVPMKVDDLHFDRQNPRLAEFGVSSNAKDEQVIKILWDAMDVRELVQSIAASGFFEQEALVVAKEGGKTVVIEGNRRLAALKLLRDPSLAKEHGWEVPHLSKAAIERLDEVPAVVSNREASWRYVGFKHVNGPAKWSSYAKARYIAEVHKRYDIPLADISDQIGDRHKTVQRLYRGLMVLEQAESEKVFDREDSYRPRLAFSHLYTGLDYEGFTKFLSLKDAGQETEKPVPRAKIKELGEVCVWLYGSRKQNIPPKVESQNPDLSRLNLVLLNREAVAALRSGVELEKAFEISRPPSVIFEEALLAAKRELQTASGHLTLGFTPSDGSLVKIASSIADMASDILREMERKQSSFRKKSN